MMDSSGNYIMEQTPRHSAGTATQTSTSSNTPAGFASDVDIGDDETLSEDESEPNDWLRRDGALFSKNKPLVVTDEDLKWLLSITPDRRSRIDRLLANGKIVIGSLAQARHSYIVG